MSSCRPEAAEEAALGAAVVAVMGETGGRSPAVDRGGPLRVMARRLYAGRVGGHVALRACMDAAWNATRAVINGAFRGPPRAGEGRLPRSPPRTRANTRPRRARASRTSRGRFDRVGPPRDHDSDDRPGVETSAGRWRRSPPTSPPPRGRLLLGVPAGPTRSQGPGPEGRLGLRPSAPPFLPLIPPNIPPVMWRVCPCT